VNNTVKAITSIEEFNTFFKTKLEDEKADTIAGFLIDHINHVPKRGETFTVEGIHFKIIEADTRRIHALQVKLV